MNSGTSEAIAWRAPGASDGATQPGQFGAGPLSLVQSAHDAVARYLAGNAEWPATLFHVKRVCEQLRIDAREETTSRLVGLAITLAGRLETKPNHSTAADNPDSLKISLKLALRDLEAHLLQLSLMD